MLIELRAISLSTLEKFIALSAIPGQDNLPPHADEENVGKDIEEMIEDYLSTPHNENEALLEQSLLELSDEELVEIIALYYYFSKLLYDTEIKSEEEQAAFWKLCGENAGTDIKRIGQVALIEYLKTRVNLSRVLGTARVNLK